MAMHEGLLAGKVALVTGAARRNGRATALALAGAGAAVVVNTRTNMAEVEAVAAEIRAAGGRALAVQADVTAEAQVAAMVTRTVAEFGRLDILVNNAADRALAPFLEMELAEWRRVVSIILDGAFLCSRAALPHMVAAGAGRIINMGGVTGHIGAHQRAHVSTAKAGLVGLTKALAVEFGGQGITVNCVVPGKIGGPRSATAGEPPSPAGGARVLTGGEGQVEEVAAMVLHLCLPASRFITGQSLHISGGAYLP
ncbi:SDR family NAD(P)-dependent oxidoreductase [Falsiroseomonas sp.]|uniref:SDR family oxidoreductase n=1 Tax=Falsiroseomonas sp. TaxID=2870721 RepID=UPI0027211F54|nr:SDR family NAD(P)-dependent oxidoreductase [Falsiroseomonas sp.]MDO9500058.1 SDR family NAD(P)-dependent oxidoreductase [Falsiroseomonas sp.]